MAEEKGKRGGARPGAGRPKTDSKLIAFRVPKEMATYIEQHPNKTKFIKTCIERNMAAQKNNDIEKKLGNLIPASQMKSVRVPFVDMKIVAGPPIPLDSEEHAPMVDLLTTLCPHPESTYMIRVEGNSMIDANIHPGDVLVVDCGNHNPMRRDIAICELNGEYTVKRVERDGDHGFLIPANPNYKKIEIKPTDSFHVWGVVTYIIHKAGNEA